MTAGFIICQPYANQIINGTKTQEYRTFKTKKLNQPVYLLSEGLAIGIISFESIEKMETTFGKYAWNIKVLEKFTTPTPYHRKTGQQIWVKEVLLT